MGIFFTTGEKKVRPGVYQRYENIGGPQIAGATNGIVACCIRSNWGPLNKVLTFDNIDQAKAAYGGGGVNGTVSDVLEEVFTGGAIKVHCVRLGSSGTKGSTILKDTSNRNILTMTTKYEGDRQLQYCIRPVLGDALVKEFIVFEGTSKIERFTFAAKTSSDTNTELDRFMEVAKNSKYFDFIEVGGYTGDKTIGNVTQTNFPKGTNPTVVNGDYSSAFSLLEAYRYNTICVDTCDIQVHTLLSSYIDRVYQGGLMAFAVIGEPTDVALETRMAHARSYNNYKMIYVGGGWIDALGNTVDGVRAAARVAGMVAAIPADQSTTHRVISGAVDVAEMLTNSQYENTIKSGMLTFSMSNTGSVWIEVGITTLVTLVGEDDEGWKKIKRCKIRFELMTRASDTVEPLIGNINNNADGRAVVMTSIQKLLNLMVAEDKLQNKPSIWLDKDNPPAGDSAWFKIQADDVDALEKMYFIYQFRYAPEDAVE